MIEYEYAGASAPMESFEDRFACMLASDGGWEESRLVIWNWITSDIIAVSYFDIIVILLP